ncbi:MAG: thioredoxin domain-containing protein [Limnochordales bacterium]|nr:thioredoxin domain-containing protein [Limnochordales bacterium]
MLGPEDGRLACEYFGVTEAGNFERGRSVLHGAVDDPAAFAARQGWTDAQLAAWLASVRKRLLAARAIRPRPHRDEKIITAWNGLMISAFARAGRALGKEEYINAAIHAAEFILSRLRLPDGRLWRSFRERPGPATGFLEDYAAFVNGLLDLYEATFAPRYLELAIEYLGRILDHFFDREQGCLWSVETENLGLADGPRLIAAASDQSTPSPVGLFLLGALRLRDAFPNLSSGGEGLGETIEQVLASYSSQMDGNAWGCATLWRVALRLASGSRQIVLVGAPDEPGFAELRRVVDRAFLPSSTLFWLDPRQPVPPGLPLWEGKDRINGRPAAYVCQGETCRQPATSAEELRIQLLPAGGRGGANP